MPGLAGRTHPHIEASFWRAASGDHRGSHEDSLGLDRFVWDPAGVVLRPEEDYRCHDREPTLQEQLERRLPKTAFGLACEKRGIEIISAYSPQAKGRVERKHGVYQDRFVKELRLRSAKTIAEANMVLQGGFIEKLNKKFARAPLAGEDLHILLSAHQDLRDIFCFEQTRSVGHDWVVRSDNHFYQLIRGHEPLPRATSKVTIRTWLDGSVHILHSERRVEFQEFVSQKTGGTKG